jgi:Flp pilus assembly pilin Flp
LDTAKKLQLKFPHGTEMILRVLADLGSHAPSFTDATRQSLHNPLGRIASVRFGFDRFHPDSRSGVATGGFGSARQPGRDSSLLRLVLSNHHQPLPLGSLVPTIGQPEFTMNQPASIRQLLQRVHRDEEGAVSLETILIIGAIAIPILIFILKVGWPRIRVFFTGGMDDLEVERSNAQQGVQQP